MARLVPWLKNLCKMVQMLDALDLVSVSSGGIESVKLFPGTQKNQMEFESVSLPLSVCVADIRSKLCFVIPRR